METLKRRKELPEDGSAKGMSRRGFIKFAGALAGGAAALSLPDQLQAKGCSDWASGSSSNKKFWKKVQKEFIIDKDFVYMNIGTTGSMPKDVIENYNEYNKIVAQRPWDNGGDFPTATDMRAILAPQFGAEAGQFVITGNTTEGMCMVINGVELGEGDEVIYTHHEHVAGTSPLAIVKDRRGVVLKKVFIPVYHDGNQFTQYATYLNELMQNFTDLITANTKLIVFSHITYKTGTRLPAEEICTTIKSVYPDIQILIDGAHTPGMLNLDFNAMGCDYYAGSGHKWQCGPGGTGILYIKDSSPDQPGKFWPTLTYLYEYRWFNFYPAIGLDGTMGGVLQSHGNPNFPELRALVDSCNFWEEIGRQTIEDYVLDLSSYCKQRILATFSGIGFNPLFAPDIRELSSGLTSFNPFNDRTGDAGHDKASTFVSRLRDEYGFVIRYTDFKIASDDEEDTYALRISTHLFHDYDQVDDLVDAMYELYLDMGP